MELWKKKQNKANKRRINVPRTKLSSSVNMGLVNHIRLSTLCQAKMEHALYATDLSLYQRIKRIFQHWETMRKKVTGNAFPWNKAGNII